LFEKFINYALLPQQKTTPSSSLPRRAQGLLSVAHLQLLLDNGVSARKLLVQHNLRLVISIAKRYTNRGVEISDLVQEVCRLVCLHLVLGARYALCMCMHNGVGAHSLLPLCGSAFWVCILPEVSLEAVQKLHKHRREPAVMHLLRIR